MNNRIILTVLILFTFTASVRGGVFFNQSLLTNREIPNVLSLFAIEETTTSILLTWTSGGGTTSDYRISYQSGSTAPASCLVGTQIPASSVNGTYHFVTGLTANTTYSFRVCGINSALQTSPGTTVTLKTPASQPIFRSTGYNQTTAKASGGANQMTINASSIATFTVALADNIGVGDAIQYSTANNATMDRIVFIHGRLSSTEYMVKTSTGSAPTTVTSNTTWGLFRAYTSVTNAEAGTENTGINAAVRAFESWSNGYNIVGAGLNWNIACYADAIDIGLTDITGWTAGANNKFRIFAPYETRHVGVRQRHQGVWDTATYFTKRNTNNETLHIDQTHTIIEGLQLENQSSADWEDVVSVGDVVAFPASGVAEINGNIVYYNATGSFTTAFGINSWQPGSGMSLYITNNIIIGPTAGNAAAAGIGTHMSSDVSYNIYAYNNTIVGRFYYGIKLTSGVATVSTRAKNNLVQNSLTAAYNSNSGGNWHGDSRYNLAYDTTAPGTNTLNSRTVSFVSAAGLNYHVQMSDTAAHSAGVDLSADASYPINNDIDGTTRSGTWDVGADAVPNSFLVMTSATYTGNLGGVLGADASCLSDLTAGSWLGKANASVDAAHVKAFICDNLKCNNLYGDTTYAFARSGSGASGGAYLNTNSSGAGPGSTGAWNGVTYFDVSAVHSTGRATGSNTFWPLTPSTEHCVSWKDATAGSNGSAGDTAVANTGLTRWNNGGYACNGARRLVCIVHP